MCNSLLERRFSNEDVFFRLLPIRHTNIFFNYVSDKFRIEEMGACIDWSHSGSHICVDISTFSYEDIKREIIRSGLSNYEYLTFSYTSEEESIVLKIKDALELLHLLLLGSGDAYIYGAKQSSHEGLEYDFGSLVEIYSGNWLCYLE